MNITFFRGSVYWLLCFFTLSNTAFAATPIIKWSPSSVNQQVTAGQSITIPISFIASENISDNPIVRVDPRLTSFVTVSPSSFGSITKGQTINLNLTISAPPSAPSGTSDGTVQIKSELKPKLTFSKPLPVTITVITSMTPQEKIQSLEDQGAIPKLDRTSDIQGPDVNANSIRDDVDTYIADHYPLLPQRAAAEQFARVMQAAILVDKNDATAVKAAALESAKAVHCIYTQFDGNAGTKQAAAVIEEIESISTSTKARLLAYLAFAKALDGTSGSVPEGDTCE
jgi:hypothetical protein